MKIIVLSAFIILFAASSVAQQRRGRVEGLPAGALIVETRPVTANRALVLWMLGPTKNPRDTTDNLYTCPEETRGSYYRGATRVSLLDTKTRRVINTISIRQEYNDDADEFDIPYRIHAGSYYHVEGVARGREGRPTIMWLKDYNGDGSASEFALFDAQACMGLETTLIGFSERQDKVIQYPIHVAVEQDGTRSIQRQLWVDYLFSKKPGRPGYWRYEIDYRGRGGLLEKYEIRYHRRLERFEGNVVYARGE